MSKTGIRHFNVIRTSLTADERQRLKDAAKRETRSLTGHVTHILRKSLQEEARNERGNHSL